MNAALDYRPSPGVSVSIGPKWLDTRNVAQYLRTVPDPTATETFGSRYVFGDLLQTEVSIESRVNVVLSPTVSLQAYVQPLVSVGDYGAIREFARPHTYDFRAYGAEGGSLVAAPADGALTIDPDGPGPASPFQLADPDFNIKSLRLNGIMRWEWMPGSTLYVAWTESRRNADHPGDYAFGRDMADLFSAPADDVFMVKVAWWIGR